MSVINWSLYDDELLKLVSQTDVGSYVDVYNILAKKYPYENFTYDAVQGRIYRLFKRRMVSDKPPSGLPYVSKYFDYLIGSKLPEPKTKIAPLGRKRLTKTLHAADIHVPFQDEVAVDKAFSANLDADVVVTSEVLDCYSLNPFYKEKPVSLEAELDEALRLFEYLNETFPITYITEANHDDRVKRIISKRLPTELLFLCTLELVEVLTRPFPNIIYIPSWWLQLGDVIYAHAPTHSKIDMKAGWNVYQYFHEWGDVLGVKPPFNVIVQAHTHYLGSFYRPTKKIIESGCLCTLAEWVIHRYQTRPWVQGYTVIMQEDGKAIIDLCREHLIE
jgi:hypothetical protein